MIYWRRKRRVSMRIGLISDIHGNIVALEKILKIFEKQNIETILCGGDIIGLGPHPEEVVSLLQTKKGVISVKGNHEGYLIDGIPTMLHGRSTREIEIMHHTWVNSILSDSSKEYIKSFPKELYFPVGEKTIYLTHYPMEENGSYKRFMKVADDETMKELFQNIEADAYLYGHTHVSNPKMLNGKWHINVGSLGCPIKGNIAYAGILTVEGADISYEQIAEEYEADKVREEIQKMQYPFYDEVLEVFY